MKDEKEEIKPAPLGESSEELKPNFTQIANDHYDRVGRRQDKREHDLEVLAYRKGYIDAYNKYIPSPTSEPPEEQEELWKLAVSFIMDSHDAGLNYLISNLKDSFTIHRKRD